MKVKKIDIVKDFKQTGAFSYVIGNMNLSFTLRTDIPNDLVNFLECLKEAQKDLEELLETKYVKN